jgi:hypothetical protein
MTTSRPDLPNLNPIILAWGEASREVSYLQRRLKESRAAEKKAERAWERARTDYPEEMELWKAHVHAETTATFAT